MKITDTYKGRSAVEYIFEYEDTDSFDNLEYKFCRQIYAVCYLENTDKIVIVHNGKADTWGLIGGTIENNESFEETLRREIKEEGNLELISYKPLGVQKVIDSRDNSYIYQLRCACTARSYGDFKKDPSGSIDKIEVIDPKDYKKYFDWKDIGDRIFERAESLIKEF